MPPAIEGRHLGRGTCTSTTARRADMQPEFQQTPLMRTTHLAGADSPKTQTTSPLAARCQRFSPNGSALWRPHHLKSRCHRHQSGGIALHGGSTRRRHAARRLRVVQNPPSQPDRSAPRHLQDRRRAGWREKTRPTPQPQHKERGTAWHGAREQRQGTAISPPTGTKTTREHNTTLPTRTAPGPSGTKLSPHSPSHRMSGTKFSLLARNGPISRLFCMQGEFYTVLTTKKPSRENFVPNARQSRG